MGIVFVEFCNPLQHSLMRTGLPSNSPLSRTVFLILALSRPSRPIPNAGAAKFQGNAQENTSLRMHAVKEIKDAHIPTLFVSVARQAQCWYARQQFTHQNKPCRTTTSISSTSASMHFTGELLTVFREDCFRTSNCKSAK